MLKRLLFLVLLASAPPVLGWDAPAFDPANPPVPASLPVFTNQLNWIGGGGPWYRESDPDHGGWILSLIGAGWSRGTMDYGINALTFAWGGVQRGGPNTWDWTEADKEMAFLRAHNWRVVIQLAEGPGGGDPPWAWSLDTNQWVAAKSAFINALATRYGSQIWGIEVQNEPQIFITKYNNTTRGGPYSGYNLHLALLKACQPARAYTRLVGWSCQAPFPSWLNYLLQNGLTNLCDAISFHQYSQFNIPLEHNLNDGSMGNPNFDGSLEQFMTWLRSQVGDMPILVDEVGMAASVPMRMAKVLIILRGGGAIMCQLHVWGFGAVPGDYAAVGPHNTPFPHAVVTAWTAYWLGNEPPTSSKTDGNVFVYTFGDRTFAWCVEGTEHAYTATGWNDITDIYGNPITPGTLTDAVTVFHGRGALLLNQDWKILEAQ